MSERGDQMPPVKIRPSTEDKQDSLISGTSKLVGDESPMIATSGVYVYIGKAAPGSSTASAVWKIKRLDTTSGIVGEWADGDTNYDNVWDNYASLTYL